MKKLSSYFRKYWYAYLIALICLLVYEALDMVSPYVTKSIIDDVIGEGKTDLIIYLLLALLTVGVGRSIVGYAKEFTFDKVSFTIASDIRKHLFGHIQSLSVDYFDKTNTGEIMARVKDDVDRIQAAFGYIGMLIITVLVHTAFVLTCMFRLSPKLTIFPIAALPVCGLIAVIMERKLDKVYDEISEENADMNTVAEENLAGVRVVKAFAREKFEITKFLAHNKKYYDLNMTQSKVWIKYNPLFQLITSILPLASLIWGGIMVVNGEISLGTLGAFIEYCANAVWPMTMLGWLSNELASSFASKKKLDKIYAEVAMISDGSAADRSESVAKSAGGKSTNDRNVSVAKSAGGKSTNDRNVSTTKSADRRGSMEFDHVSLTIGEKEILKDISFKLESGKTLGIMGATGSGKSSIINMLLRFYDPSNGRVMLDGTDIRELPLETVRKSTAAVMQDVFLFSDTISENVRMGMKENMTDDIIEDSLKCACASEFVEGLSDKAETIIGERGVGLSGGQKQRISMARAFAKKAPILVLDDSTSALDMETEHQVQKNLEGISGMTKIIIAHRISAVRKADEIIVLENGRIIEHGNHESLMAQNGYYRKTYEAQYGDPDKVAGKIA